MKSRLILTVFCFLTFFLSHAQPLDSILPVRGFSIAAPTSKLVDSFVMFINDELAPRKVNTLILRVDYNYQYKSRPELAHTGALSLPEVKKRLCMT